MRGGRKLMDKLIPRKEIRNRDVFIITFLYLFFLFSSSAFAEDMTFNLLQGFNGISLPFENTGINDAERLCQSIPYCESVSYWDAQTQSFVNHDTGSIENNFPLTPGYPYFVKVTQDTAWTVSGSIPVSVTFHLITTDGTDVNTVALPIFVSGITTAEELGNAITNVDTLWYWDAVNQGYAGHPMGIEINNFSVYPGYPYFVNVTADTTWTLFSNKNPVANPGGPYTGYVGNPVQFDGSLSSDPDGDPLTYSWIFGDGGTGAGVSPTHIYANVGTYIVSLTVNDGRGGVNTASTTAEIKSPPAPTITDFNPREGTAGTVVTITGANFDTGGLRVNFNGKAAVIAAFTGSSITTSVPAGATTGPITVTTSVGSALSAEPFTVLARQDFTLNISPQSVSIPSNGSASAVLSLQSTGGNVFPGLVRLSINNMPAGVSAVFKPEYVSVNQASVLTVGLTSGSAASLNIDGTSDIDGAEVMRTVTLTLNPLPPGATTLSGQVLASRDAKPIMGVTLRIGDRTAVTDGAGNFVIIDPPTGEQVLLVDGYTANTEDASYPSALPVPVTIVGGENNLLPYKVYLHEVNTKNFTVINNTQDTIVTDPNIPNYEMLIPAGTVIMGWDGLPNDRISVKPIAIDRLPIKSPPAGVYAKEIYMYYFFKPGGGNPSQPIPVKMPNTVQANPGARVNLWYYDESPITDPNSNQWKQFGMGTVSDDGRNIIPDPGVGIPKFCCGASFPSLSEPPDDGDDGPDDDDDGCDEGDPVDINNGKFKYTENDVINPLPSMIRIQRIYNSGNGTVGPFGRGTSINYNYFLQGGGDALTYITPIGTRYVFSKNTDSSYTNINYPFLRGAKAYLNADNTRTLRFKDGKTYTFDTNGRLIRETDSNGNWVSISRNQNGFINGLSDNLGNQVIISLMNIQHGAAIYTVISSVAFNTKLVAYTYGPNETLTSVTDPEGNLTSYTYEYIYNRLISIVNKRGVTQVTNEYDSEGRVIRQTHVDGGVYTFDYNVVGGIVTGTKATRPNGDTRSYRFNNSGYVSEVTDSYGQRRFIERAFGTNEKKSITDILGRKTTYTYDENANIASTTDPAGNITTYEYDLVFNKPTKITDALGNITTMTYDSKGNLIETQTPDSQTTTIGYNTYGQPVTITDTLGNTSSLEYDSRGNLIKTTNSLGNETIMEYDINRRLIWATDPKGNMTDYVYDNLDRVIEVTDGLGNSTDYTYDANGNLKSVTDAKGQTINYNYNSRDKVASMTDQLGHTETYTYDYNDNLVSVTDRKGQITNYTYDKQNRITRTDYSDGSYTAYTYDAVGRLFYIYDSISGPIEYVYSDTGCSGGCSGGFADKVIQEITPQGSISYAYDAIGRRTTMTVAGQPAVNYTYDANSRLTNLVIASEAWQSLSFAFAYDALGRRISTTLPNGVTTNYTYDNGSRLLNIEHLNPAQQLLESLTYTIDATGNRTSMNRQSATLPLPNPASNINYNQANQMLTFQPSTEPVKNMSYDENGNMTSITNGCGTTTYTWDARNRLVGINGFTSTSTSTSTCTSLTASFRYDALGRRIEKTINGRTIQYLYDGLDIVQEIENGQATVNYVRTLNIDEPLARIKVDGTIRYYQRDALGSVIALTDETGIVRTSYTYDPFGNTTISGEASDSPFQYTGRENDGTGLYYYRARYYSPELQRFISEDPILKPGNPNVPFMLPALLKNPAMLHAYAYVGNNPVNRKDPLGLSDKCRKCDGTWVGEAAYSTFIPSGGCTCYWWCTNWGNSIHMPDPHITPGVVNGDDCQCPDPDGETQFLPLRNGP